MPNRLKVGDMIITVADAGSKDWLKDEPSFQNRRWGVDGKITEVHDSHGLVYKVKHIDGAVAAYEHREVATLFMHEIQRTGVTDKELAREFSVSFPTAQRWRSGENAPHPAMRKYVFDWLKDRKNV